MGPPAVDAPSPPQTPLNNINSVPVSPKSIAPPRLAPPARDDDTANEADTHGRSESIDQLSLNLMVKIQQVFGQNSAEWKEINRALLQFKHRAMSKKEAHRIMTQVLINKEELNHDLLKILYHDDASWGPEDWSQSINPPQTVNPTSPNFLQPSHELQFHRLPSMFQALGGHLNAPRPQLSINPTVLHSPSIPHTADRMHSTPYHNTQESSGSLVANCEGYVGYGGQQEQFTLHSQVLPTNWNPNPFVPNSLPSPAHLMPNPVHLSQHYASASWHQDPTLAPPGDVRHELGLNPSVQAFTGLGQSKEMLPSTASTAETYQQYPQFNHWQNVHYTGGWPNDDLWQHEQGHNTAEHQTSHVSPSLHNQATPQLASRQLSSDASPSIATPTTSVANVPRLFQNELNKGQAEYMASMQNIRKDTLDEYYEDATTNDEGSQTGLSGENEAKRSSQRTPKPEGSFIHAICGKGFHSRSAVKKHHWGPKAGDLAATRGCWAKNKKPAIAWDAHPSCHIGSTQPNSNHLQPIASEDDDSVSTSSKLNAAPAPSMVSRRPTVQGFSGSPAHGLDTLVSAASFAERIDAPNPQGGRSDSIVAQLDAQAAAAERIRRVLPPWTTPTGFGTALTGRDPYMQMQSPVAGLGITHNFSDQISPTPMVPSQQFNGSTSRGDLISHAQATQEEDSQSKVESSVSKKRQRATSKKANVSKRKQKVPESLPPSPNQKKAKVQK